LYSRHKKGTQQTDALGRLRGGLTTKLHARCDANGRPLGFVLTPGQTHEVNALAPLFRMITDKIEALLADKDYDADAMFGKLKQHHRIATRYDKTVLSFESFLNLAASCLWLKSIVNTA
jgi:transposase